MTTDIRHVVMVGNGMVGHRLCQGLAEAGSLAITVIGEEPVPAYDRVHLSSCFTSASTDSLLLSPSSWYAKAGIRLQLSDRCTHIDRAAKVAETTGGLRVPYDFLVLATGSAPFIPPGISTDKGGVFVYRTVRDAAGIRDAARTARHAVVIGGGLLGLEAAKGARDLGLGVTVVEVAPRLMPRQVDEMGGRLLREKVEALGVAVKSGCSVKEILGDPVSSVRLSTGEEIEAQLVIVSAGIRPRDELARASGLAVGARGGIIVDDSLRTSDPAIFAIGECALHREKIYGLVAPGYQMADAVAAQLTGGDARFTGSVDSCQLKVLGIDVAAAGASADAIEGARDVLMMDFVRGVYKKVLVSADQKRVLGCLLIGDLEGFGELSALTKTGEVPPENLSQLFSTGGSPAANATTDRVVCSCNSVRESAIRAAASQGCESIPEIKKRCRAGTGCGGCVPQVAAILNDELMKLGRGTKIGLCPHFDYTRQELYHLVRVGSIRTFEALLERHGRGEGCEICKPTAASLFASIYGDTANQDPLLQDTNDRFLANLQRGGTYSVVPRIPAGEITPTKLATIAQVAEEFGLYTKITGAQRIDMFGAERRDLPAIWEKLVAAGFESGHAYGKALRAVKSCVGSTWCRYGLHDSVGFAIRIEERYKGLRAPHKLKSGVSGCVRECAEAQGKDFGLVATEAGWNLYVCGNGGTTPKHAVLLASDVEEETVIRYLDRFLMFYIRTADKLTRTAAWLEQLEGGIDYLRSVIIEDRLGIAEELEADMAGLIATYKCEWREVVESPELRARYTRPSGDSEPVVSLPMVPVRDQRQPAPWEGEGTPKRRLPMATMTNWLDVGPVASFVEGSGHEFPYAGTEIAVFRLSGERWFAIDNRCSHRADLVLARGLVADDDGVPTVACPHHKKKFALSTGACVTEDAPDIDSFPVCVEAGRVWIAVPSEDEMRARQEGCPDEARCQSGFPADAGTDVVAAE